MEQDGKIVPNGTWLADTRAVERDKGVDYRKLACNASVLTPYIRDRLSRAARGIEELYGQLPSALVPDDAQRLLWEAGREAYVVRVCEVIQHLGVALTAVGCTDEELIRALVCEEVVNDEKGDDSSIADDVSETHTPDGVSSSESTTAVSHLVDARTKVRESSN